MAGETEDPLPLDSLDRVPLAETLIFVASELRAVAKAAKEKAKLDPDAGPVMTFTECEVDFAIEVEGQVGGELKVYVIKLKGGVSRTSTNTIKIKFEAIDGSPVSAPALAPEGTLGAIERQTRPKESS